MRAVSGLASVLVLSILLAACSAAGPGGSGPPSGRPSSSPSSGPTTPTTGDLAGRTFLSTGSVGHQLVAGSQVRLAFQATSLSLAAGCNSMGGDYRIVDGRLSIGQMVTTEMGCQADLMTQDQWLAGFVDGAAVALDGPTLTLKDGDVTMTLTDRMVADPDRPLEGTHWVVDGIIAGDAVSSVPARLTAWLEIKDGRISLDTGCNTGSGSATHTDSTLTVGPIALTRKACPPDATALERAMTRVLTGDVAYTIEASTLTLHHGTDGLTLRAGS